MISMMTTQSTGHRIVALQLESPLIRTLSWRSSLSPSSSSTSEWQIRTKTSLRRRSNVSLTLLPFSSTLTMVCPSMPSLTNSVSLTSLSDVNLQTRNPTQSCTPRWSCRSWSTSRLSLPQSVSSTSSKTSTIWTRSPPMSQSVWGTRTINSLS